MSRIRRLKQYLFNEEQETIATLQGRIADIDQRAVDIAEALPHALLYSETDEEQFNKLTDSLKRPVSATIQDSIKTDPDGFADMLFPVLGPSIRKAVSEGMRALTERLNRVVEHSFSARSWRWRWESIRTGAPLTDIILRETLVYRVEQLFIIQRESGRLICHVQDEDVLAIQDSDAVSAMLSAIQDFVRDSFGAYGQSDLNTVQIGGRTVWILHGPHAMLAAVFFGAPNIGLRSDFQLVNETIHSQFAELLTTNTPEVFQEETADLEQTVKPLLTSDTRGNHMRDEDPGFVTPKSILLSLGLMLLVFSWVWAQQRQYLQNIDALATHLSATPGVVLLSREQRDNHYVFRLLKDGSVHLPVSLLREFSLEDDEVKFDIASFQSTDPEVLVQKITAYINAPASVDVNAPASVDVNAPASVDVSISNGTLVISGEGTTEWVEEISRLPFAWLGVGRVDLSALTTAAGNDEPVP